MADEQQLLGQPYEFEWRGKTLKFGGLTDGVITKCVATAKLAAVLERDENIEIFYSGSDQESQSERAKYLREFEEDMITGRWKWGGDLQEKWRKGNNGFIVFVGALLEAGGTPLTKAEIYALSQDVDKRPEVTAAIALCLWDIEHPNEPRPPALEAMTARLNSKKSTASLQPNAA